MTKNTNNFNKVNMKSVAEQLGVEERVVKDKYISGRSNSITGLGSDALLADSVSTAQIIDASITTDKIGSGAVTADQLNPTYTSAKLSATYTSAASATWQDTAFDITLVTAGTWVLLYNLRLGAPSAASDYTSARIYNETTAAVVTDSHRLGGYVPGSASIQNTIPLSEIVVTTTGYNVMRVEIKPSVATACSLISDTQGLSSVIAWRIG